MQFCRVIVIFIYKNDTAFLLLNYKYIKKKNLRVCFIMTRLSDGTPVACKHITMQKLNMNIEEWTVHRWLSLLRQPSTLSANLYKQSLISEHDRHSTITSVTPTVWG